MGFFKPQLQIKFCELSKESLSLWLWRLLKPRRSLVRCLILFSFEWTKHAARCGTYELRDTFTLIILRLSFWILTWHISIFPFNYCRRKAEKGEKGVFCQIILYIDNLEVFYKARRFQKQHLRRNSKPNPS